MRKSTVETSLKCGRFRCLYSIALHFISVLRILKGTGLSQRSLSGCDFRKDSKKKKSKKRTEKKKNWSEQVNLLSTWYGPIVGSSSLMIRSGILFTFFFVEFFHRSYLPPPPLQSPWHSYPSRNQTTLPCYLRKAKPRCVFPFTSFSAVAAINSHCFVFQVCYLPSTKTKLHNHGPFPFATWEKSLMDSDRPFSCFWDLD